MAGLSNLAHRVQGQPMFKTIEKTRGIKGLIHLEIGDPEMWTPLPVIHATCRSLYDGETHYCDSTGLLDFKKAIQKITLKSRGFKPDLNQILVTPGANIIIYLTMMCLVDPGNFVYHPNPGFPTYQAVMNLFPPYPFEHIHNQKLIIINSPNNPTGKVMSEDEIKDAYNMAPYILSDEVYSRIIYEDKFFSPSMIDKCKEKTILMNSFSKGFAMTGFRLGVAIGPAEIIEKMGLLLQTLVSCVPPFIQRGGIEALKQPYKSVIDHYRVKRDILCHALNIEPNQGAFYLFPKIKNGMTSQGFTDLALKHKVVILPGSDFGLNGEGYIRISYAGKIEDIIEGAKRLKRIW